MQRKLRSLSQLFVCTSLLQSSVSGADESGQPPYVVARYTGLPTAAVEDLGPATELAGKEHRLSFGIYQWASEENWLAVGIDYEYTHFDYSNINSRDRDLHRLQFPITFASTFDQWQVRGFVAPGVSTSSNIFKDFLNRGSADDALLTARAILSPQQPGSHWFAGVAYDRSFGEPRLYPVAGIEWMPAPELSLRLAFPDSAFRWQASQRQSLQGRISPAGHQWRVVSDDFTREFDYSVESWRAELNWNISLWRHVSLDLAAGYDMARKHEFAGGQGNSLRSGIDDTVYLAVGFRVGDAPLPFPRASSF